MVPGQGIAEGQIYHVFPDGQRFVIVTTYEQEVLPSVGIVENWYEQFRDCEQD